jgi:predicted nucleic acid-binding protein
LILIDSYGWIEYFTEGPLANAYAKYIEEANEENNITPTIVVYEVYKKLKNKKGEQNALEAYAQITRTKIIELTAKLSLEAAETNQSTGLGMADSIVLATARAHNAQIITSDLHLKDIKETKFIKQ